MRSPNEKLVIRPELMRLLEPSGLAPLRVAGRRLLPIVQGGMGIGVSAHRLAGTVAAEGGVGTLSSVDLRRHHPDLMERTRGLGFGADAKQCINAANLEALEREVAAARRIAGSSGAVAHVKERCTKAFDCLAQCGLRDGKAGWGQFCIDQQLAAALRGDVKRGLFFTGRGALPFGSQIRSVHDLLVKMLGGDVPPEAVPA